MKVPLDVFTTGNARQAFFLNGLFVGEVYQNSANDYFVYHCLGRHNDRRYFAIEYASEALTAEMQSWWDTIPGNSKLDRARANLQYNEADVNAGIAKAEKEEELEAQFLKLESVIRSSKRLHTDDLADILHQMKSLGKAVHEALRR